MRGDDLGGRQGPGNREESERFSPSYNVWVRVRRDDVLGPGIDGHLGLLDGEHRARPDRQDALVLLPERRDGGEDLARPPLVRLVQGELDEADAAPGEGRDGLERGLAPRAPEDGDEPGRAQLLGDIELRAHFPFPPDSTKRLIRSRPFAMFSSEVA